MFNPKQHPYGLQIFVLGLMFVYVTAPAGHGIVGYIMFYPIGLEGVLYTDKIALNMNEFHVPDIRSENSVGVFLLR